MHKDKILTIVSVILSIALIVTGVICFNNGKEIKRLQSEIDKNKNINNTLKLDNKNLVEQNKLANESLEQQKERVEKYQNALYATQNETDKIYNDLNNTIKNNKATIDNLKKEIETLKTTVLKKDSEIKDLKSLLSETQKLDKIIQERLTAAIEQADNLLKYVNNKIIEYKDNAEVIKVLEEIKSGLEAIINND